MGLHRYIFDLPQISNWLNQNKLDSEKVTPEELRSWADAGCFPVEKKGTTYRISEDTLPLVEETKHLVKTEDLTIDEAKSILRKTIQEKEMHFEKMEKLAPPSPDTLLLMEYYNELTKQTVQDTGNGMILALVDTESSLRDYQKETINETEEKVKGAIIHSEVRMKTVLERVEKRIIQHIDSVLNNANTEQVDADELSLLIQKHQEELLGLTQYHEVEMDLLKEQTQKELEEEKAKHIAQYEELVQANFFKRMKLKKEWQQKK